MQTLVLVLIVAAFVAFLAYRHKVTEKVGKALNAAMKKWRKDTDGG
jgi:hypothetical protein